MLHTLCYVLCVPWLCLVSFAPLESPPSHIFGFGSPPQHRGSSPALTPQKSRHSLPSLQVSSTPPSSTSRHGSLAALTTERLRSAWSSASAVITASPSTFSGPQKSPDAQGSPADSCSHVVVPASNHRLASPRQASSAGTLSLQSPEHQSRLSATSRSPSSPTLLMLPSASPTTPPFVFGSALQRSLMPEYDLWRLLFYLC